MSGIILGTVTECGICLNSHFFKQFHYWTYITVPAFFGALGFYFAPKHTQELHTLTLSQWVYNFKFNKLHKTIYIFYIYL